MSFKKRNMRKLPSFAMMKRIERIRSSRTIKMQKTNRIEVTEDNVGGDVVVDDDWNSVKSSRKQKVTN
jgi:hypothetical protein